MELKVESEKVLEAAKQCPDVKRALKTMFPKAFESDKSLNLGLMRGEHEYLFSKAACQEANVERNIIVIRSNGEYEDRAFYLESDYDWEIKEDNLGQTCLIPTRKGG